MCVWKFHNESYYFAQLITHSHKSKIILAVIVGKYGRKANQGREREFIETAALLGAGSNCGVEDDSIANVEVEQLLGFG